MADDNSTIAWRIQRIEESLRDLASRVVSTELYSRDRAELERRISDLEHDIVQEQVARREADLQEQAARKEGDRDLRDAIAGQGTNWRQAIYAGVIPGLLFLIGILLQLKGGK